MPDAGEQYGTSPDTVGQIQPPAGAPAPDTKPPADKALHDMFGDLAGEYSRSLERTKQLESQRQTELTQQTQGINAELAKGMPGRPDLEAYPEAPKISALIDKKGASEFMSVAFALSALAGAVTHQPMISGLNAFSGAINGYAEGNKEIAAQQFKKFQDDFARAKTINNERLSAYKDILDNNKLSLGTKMTMLKDTAQQYRDDITAEHAKRGDIRSLIQAMDASRRGDQMMSVRMAEIEARITQANANRAAKPLPVIGPDGKPALMDPNTGEYVKDAEGNVVSPAPKTNMSSLVQGMNATVLASMQEIASNLENGVKLAAGTNTGALPYLASEGGFTNYLKDRGIRGISTDEQKVLQNLAANQGTALATIMRGGRSQGIAGLSTAVQKKMNIDAGDSLFVAAFKIADIKRVSREYVESLITQGQLTGQQADSARAQMDRMDKAVPWTTSDIIDALQKSTAKPSYKADVVQHLNSLGASIRDEAQIPVLKNPDDVKNLPSGSKFYDPNGVLRVAP